MMGEAQPLPSPLRGHDCCRSPPHCGLLLPSRARSDFMLHSFLPAGLDISHAIMFTSASYF